MKTYGSHPLTILFCGGLLLSGCRHEPPQFAEVAALTSPSGSPLLNAAPGQPANGLRKVSLTNQLDPAWLQPPTQLFTLGPGDRLEIELIGEPTSRVMT